jgi:hypothetical protein
MSANHYRASLRMNLLLHLQAEMRTPNSRALMPIIDTLFSAGNACFPYFGQKRFSGRHAK